MIQSSMAVFFWMLGQDVARRLPGEWGFRPSPRHPRVFQRGALLLHQLGLAWESEECTLGFCRQRRCLRCYPAGTAPPFTHPGTPVSSKDFRRHVLPELRAYESWVQERLGRDYRRRLLALCPPALRPFRRQWKADFGWTADPQVSRPNSTQALRGSTMRSPLGAVTSS